MLHLSHFPILSRVTRKKWKSQNIIRLGPMPPGRRVRRYSIGAANSLDTFRVNRWTRLFEARCRIEGSLCKYTCIISPCKITLILKTKKKEHFKALCRRGAEAVQFYAECAVIQSALPVPPRTMGTLYVRAANIGHPFSNQIGEYLSISDAILFFHIPSHS